MPDANPLLAHILLFVPLVVVVSLVYHGLRRESLREIAVVSVRRLLFWIPAAVVFGFLAYEFTRWL
ncbi:MAG: hypothetical protein AB1486_19870 [Planctomycetota bacterium]